MESKFVIKIKKGKEKLTRIRNVRNTTKFKRSIKAISPVIATLLMIAIAVVASLVVYAWVSGYMGTTTTKAGKAIQIQSYAPTGTDPLNPTSLLVYVQNVGQGDVELSQTQSVYIDANMVSITNPTPPSAKIPITVGQTVELTVPLPSTYKLGDKIDIKVTTTDGTFMTASGKGTSSTGGGSNTNTLAAPTVTAGSASVNQGQSSSLTSSAVTTGTAPYTYQWLQEVPGGSTFTTIAGATTSSYSFVTTGTTATGVWTFELRVTDSASATVTSAPATVTVNAVALATPTVSVPTLAPVSPITLGASVTASVTVTGSAGTATGTVTFQVSTDSGTTWNTLGAVKTLASGSAVSDSYTPTIASSNYRFRAVYSGDSKYNGATGSTTSLTVDPVSHHTVSFAQSGSTATVTVSYQIDGGSTQTGNCPFSVQLNQGQSISYTYPATVSGGTGKQYVISTAASPASPQTVATSDISISATYKTQYQVTFATNHGSTTPTGTNWYDSGAQISISTTYPGYNHYFNHWTSSTGKTTFDHNDHTSATATITGTDTITAVWY